MSQIMLEGHASFDRIIVGWNPSGGHYFLQASMFADEEEPDYWYPVIATMEELIKIAGKIGIPIDGNLEVELRLNKVTSSEVHKIYDLHAHKFYDQDLL